MKNLNNWKFVLLALVVGLFLGWVFFGGSATETAERIEEHVHDVATQYTCSMHPQIRQAEMGKCPICGMDLIPVADGSEAGTPGSLQMTEAALRLASIQTTVVSRQQSIGEIKLSGKVAVDKRLVFNQSAHFPGRIEKLYVKFEGESVIKGRRIASIYSPELITAQEELLEAYKTRENNEVLWNAARNKIRLWKLPDSFIEDVVTSGNVKTTIDILAESSGVVTNLVVSEGDHLHEGSVLFEIANLKNLWVLLDAYETDLPLIQINDQVHFSIPSLPGEHFHGNVTYIDPIINPTTRTVSVRADVVNSSGSLKPDMFVDGLIVAKGESTDQLLIPRSAVLWTGSRSIVYVKEPQISTPSFLMREVDLGPRSGESYVVISGLLDGEEVVTNGVFSVDAAAQLQGKPSMMNTGVGEVTSIPTQTSSAVSINDQVREIPIIFKEQLKDVYLSYLKVKDALIETNSAEAAMGSDEMVATLSKVDMGLVKGDDHIRWMKDLETMEKASKSISVSKDVEKQRLAFSELTSGLISAVKYFGLDSDKVYFQYCPMAFNNQGDFWLSDSDQVLNPYFGDKMLRCGDVVEVMEF